MKYNKKRVFTIIIHGRILPEKAAVDVLEQIATERCGTLHVVVGAKAQVLLLQQLAQLGMRVERPSHQDVVVDQVPPRAANAPAALDQTLGVQVRENVLQQLQRQHRSHFGEALFSAMCACSRRHARTDKRCV
jgi:hypothetical protein